MKQSNWILLIGLGVAAWYFMRKKVTPGTPVANLLPGGSAARAAASEAREIVADVVEKTTFLPDMSTDRDKYNADQKLCK